MAVIVHVVLRGVSPKQYDSVRASGWLRACSRRGLLARHMVEEGGRLPQHGRMGKHQGGVQCLWSRPSWPRHG